jgi:hypothetical protein
LASSLSSFLALSLALSLALFLHRGLGLGRIQADKRRAPMPSVVVSPCRTRERISRHRISARLIPTRWCAGMAVWCCTSRVWQASPHAAEPIAARLPRLIPLDSAPLSIVPHLFDHTLAVGRTVCLGLIVDPATPQDGQFLTLVSRAFTAAEPC